MRRMLLVALLIPAPLRAGDAWPFEPKPDDFSKDALFDLRSLNEATAGEKGFVTVSKDGDFLDGAGKPIRFWGINTSVHEPLPQYSSHPPRDLARHARFLAKRGVNMVRWHGQEYPIAGQRGPSNDPARVNEKALEHLFQLVAAMKKEGIYTTVSPYWANALKVPRTWKIEGPDNQDSHGLLFFNPRLQEIYKGWLRTLFTTKNPHTGLALKDDPAVAIIQIQNEDSLLFWTFQGISPQQKALLGRQFAAWAGEKHGSLEKALTAWGKAGAEGDDPTSAQLGFYGTWDMTRAAPKWEAGKARRLADQLEFLTATMRAFNQSIIDFLRKDVGCGQIINCGNWRSADTFLLDDAERYACAPGEVMGVNRYFSPPHLGDNRGWAITQKDTFANVSVLQEPRELPVSLKQVRGKAMILPESAWVTPNEYQAEGAFLASAYQSLNGVDCLYWFATSTSEWMPPTSANGFNKETLGKWVVATPTQLGQFPAAAYLYRSQLLKKGSPAVVEHRPTADLWNRKPPRIAEDPGYDPNRDAGNAAQKSDKAAIDPLAFLVGPVEVTYDGKAEETENHSAGFINQSAKTVKSNTGELTFDWGRQVVVMNAPNAQGVCGFLNKAGGKFQTDGMEITSDNEYAAILAVSLDGKPIKSSRKILLQIGTQCRPDGWKETAKQVSPKGEKPFDGKEVNNIGGGRWMVDDTRVSISLTSLGLSNATLLDANFNPVGRVKSDKYATGVLKVTLPPNAMYVLVR